MSSYNHFGCSCCGCPFNGGNCPGCSSVGSGDEFVYDSNTYSYNETPNFFNQPPQHQYETYSCEFCGGNPHPGFDCQTGNTPVFDQGACYKQDFGFNQPPFYSPSQTQQFDCCEFCVEVHIIVMIAKQETCPSMIRVLVTIRTIVMTNLHSILRISNNSSTVVRYVEVPIIALIVKPGTNLSMSLILRRCYELICPNFPCCSSMNLRRVTDYTEVDFVTKQQCTLLMGDEVINTIPARKTDEFIKSSVDDFVPIPRESEVTYDSVLECDMPATTPLPPTDNGEADFDINSPLGEYVVDFLMENKDVAGLPRHLG
ncbi:hypothetical protein Tco_1538091 [Tanacetum coccineum]